MLLVDVEDVDFALDLPVQVVEARLDVGQVEDDLLVVELERQVRGDGVGQAARIVDARDRGQDLGRNLLVELHVLVELLHHGAAQRLDLGALLRGGLDHFDRRHVGREVGFAVVDAIDARALLAFHQHLHRAVGQLQHLQNGRDAADLEHVLDRGLVLGGGLLRHQHDAALRFHRELERLDALRTADEQRNHHVGEHDHIAQRKQRQVEFGGRQGGMTGHGNPLLDHGKMVGHARFSSPRAR
jgi:hypothetical protein